MRDTAIHVWPADLLTLRDETITLRERTVLLAHRIKYWTWSHWRSSDVQSFTFRAECRCDVQRLLRVIPWRDISGIFSMPDVAVTLPDVAVTIGLRGWTLDKLRDAIRLVPEGHVMLQTVQPSRLYTGERDYDLR